MKRRVYVYTFMESDGRVWALPYLRHYNSDRACVHVVAAASGPEAKKVAMREHRACIPQGVWKATHPNGHVAGTPCACPPTFVPPATQEATTP